MLTVTKGVLVMEKMNNDKKTALVYSILILLFVFIVCFYMYDFLNELSVAMLFMIPILFSAIYNDRALATLISVVSILIFDFMFIHPRFHFIASDSNYFITFFIMFITGQIVYKLAKNATLAKEIEVSKKIEDTLLELLSHELRTPLAVIKGCSSGLLNKDLELTKLDQKNLIENIDENAEEMDRLIGNLINSAKLKNGILRVKKELCDIQDIVASAIIKTEKDIPVLFESVDNEIASIIANAVLIEQAVINLLDNALKYGHDVRVKITEENSDIIITVSNKGQIPNKSELENVVKPFLRLKNSNNHRGLGLGLHVVQLISEIHDGRLALTTDNFEFNASMYLPKKIK